MAIHSFEAEKTHILCNTGSISAQLQFRDLPPRAYAVFVASIARRGTGSRLSAGFAAGNRKLPPENAKVDLQRVCCVFFPEC